VLADQLNVVTGADNAKGVALPAAAATIGPITVINDAGANLLVYPVNGGNDQINGLAEDAAFSLGSYEQATFVATSATQWYVTRANALRKGLSGVAAVGGGTLASPVTHRFVSKTTGGAESLTLANGFPGQVLSIFLAVDGGDGTLTPTTKTGFTTITFADAGDTAVLEFVDATVGWIILGLHGLAAPPAFAIT
jgi:hypothetical protein